MNWQKSIGLLLAGVGVVVAALWFTGPSSPLASKPPAVTNKVAAVTATNTRPGAMRLPPTNALAQRPIPGPTTAATARTNKMAGTNTPASASAKPYDKAMQTLRTWSQQSWFYPVAVGVPVILGLLFVALANKKGAKAKTGSSSGPTLAAKTSGKRRVNVNQCNVLDSAGETRRLWNFTGRGNRFALHKEQAAAVGEALPAGVVAKDWRALFQPKLNVAWLPADQVFLKVVHLPEASATETLSMLEFQLEKLSPMPVAQVVWTVHPLPRSELGTQTLILMIVARGVVEEFLGKLEQEGYLADRLDLPVMGQLQTLSPESDGAYVFPGAVGGPDTALVAWFYGKVLRSLDLVTMPPHDRKAAEVREQLTQMTWSGELEGWLTGPPTWRLVGDDAALDRWGPLLREALETNLETIPPMPAAELASLSASRAAQSGAESNLVPQDFTTKYHQQFVDRLWMRALGGIIGLYVVGVVIYMLVVQFAAWRTRGVEEQVANLGPQYTNAMQLRAQYNVLKDRQELKFAALDCWKAVAELLPENITMQNLTFRDGKRLSLQGTAPMGQVQQIYAFEGAVRKALINGQPLFDATKGETLSYHTAPGGAALSWSFTLELKRTEAQ